MYSVDADFAGLNLYLRKQCRHLWEVFIGTLESGIEIAQFHGYVSSSTPSCYQSYTHRNAFNQLNNTQIAWPKMSSKEKHVGLYHLICPSIFVSDFQKVYLVPQLKKILIFVVLIISSAVNYWAKG